MSRLDEPVDDLGLVRVRGFAQLRQGRAKGIASARSLCRQAGCTQRERGEQQQSQPLPAEPHHLKFCPEHTFVLAL